MKRVSLTMLALSVMASITISVADGPHYIKVDGSFNPQDGCYSVNIKEGGLGNSGLLSVTYDLTAFATVKTVCVNKGANTVQGRSASGSQLASQRTTIQIRNGQTNGTVQLCPANLTLPDPGCTGTQEAIIPDINWDFLPGTGLSDNLGTPSPALPSLSGSNLSVPVP